MIHVRTMMTLAGLAIAANLAGCHTPAQQRQVKAYGFVIEPAKLPFFLGQDVATVKKSLATTTGPYRFTPELVDPLPRWKDYRYMTVECRRPNNPKKQCGLFLFFLPDGRLVSIYATHPLDITATPQVDVNWISGFRLDLPGDRR